MHSVKDDLLVGGRVFCLLCNTLDATKRKRATAGNKVKRAREWVRERERGGGEVSECGRMCMCASYSFFQLDLVDFDFAVLA